MKKLLPFALFTILLSGFVSARNTAFDMLFNSLYNILNTFLNPTVEGKLLLLKFLFIIIVFCVVYAGLSKWQGFNKTINAIIAIAFAFSMTLIPSALIASLITLYGALIASALLLIPLFLLALLTWDRYESASSNWEYGFLGLLWLVYSIVLSYFVADFKIGGFEFGEGLELIFSIILLVSYLVVVIFFLMTLFAGTETPSTTIDLSELGAKWKKWGSKKVIENFIKKLEDIRSKLRSASREDDVKEGHKLLKSVESLLNLAYTSPAVKDIQKLVVELEADGKLASLALTKKNDLLVLRDTLEDMAKAIKAELNNTSPTPATSKGAGSTHLAMVLGLMTDLRLIRASIK